MRHRTGWLSKKSSRFIATTAGLLMVASLTNACTSSSETTSGGENTSSSHQGSSETQAAGGTLRVGVNASSVSSLDPFANKVSQDAYTRNAALYDTLIRETADGLKWGLAVGMKANADSTVWTVKLRRNVKFHDGNTFGADDVIATFKRILNPDNAINVSEYIDFMDPNGIKKIDEHTVRFKLKRPYGPFKKVLANRRLVMVEKGSKPKEAMGTGPFELVKSTPGQQTVLKRFDDYWGEPAHIEKLVIVSFETVESLTNAVIGGQIDVTSNISQTAIPRIESNDNLKIVRSDPVLKIRIGMRADKPPFDDVRVRQAMRLLINRELALTNAFNGNGVLANDYEGMPRCEPDVPQRKQNIEKAKQLLAAAGKSDLEITLRTPDNKPGMMQEVQILAEGAKKAGVTIHVRKMDLGAYLDKWGQWTFFTGYDAGTYLHNISQYLSNDPPLNSTHWHNDKYASLAKQYFHTSDDAARCDILKKMKLLEYKKGTSIFAVANRTINVASTKVHGLKPDFGTGNLYDFTDVTLAAE